MRGDGRVFRRGNKYWIAYYAPGPDGRSHEQREPGGDTEAEARKLLRHRLREVGAHVLGARKFTGPQQERVRVEELLQNYERDCEIRGLKGLKQIRSHLKHIRAFFGMDRALVVSTARLRDFIAARQQEEAKSATINRELEGLQRAFALAVEAGTLAAAPAFPSLREDNARQGFFERGDFFAVLSKLRELRKTTDVADSLEWFYWTGMRPDEIRSLTWPCFDRETWTLRLHSKDAKTGFGRVIALEGPLRQIIERRIKTRGFGRALIFHRNGKPIGDFRKSWKTACRLAGVTGKTPYDLRRTAVRNMVRAGVPEAVAMRISGHRTRAVFDRYNIVSEKDLREAMVKTAAYIESLPDTTAGVPIAQGQK
ncbi:MAG TPA: site-specific integrase [Terriglobia bacterium]